VRSGKRGLPRGPLVAFFIRQDHWPLWKALVVTLLLIVAFRGLVDLLFRRFIPGRASSGARASSTARTTCSAAARAWFWHFWFRTGVTFCILITVVWLFRGGSWVGSLDSIGHGIKHVFRTPGLRAAQLSALGLREQRLRTRRACCGRADRRPFARGFDWWCEAAVVCTPPHRLGGR